MSMRELYKHLRLPRPSLVLSNVPTCPYKRCVSDTARREYHVSLHECIYMHSCIGNIRPTPVQVKVRSQKIKH